MLWSDPATPHLLGFAHAGDAVSSVVALSDDGSTVVVTSGPLLGTLYGGNAFVWKNGATTLIPPLSGDTGVEPVVMSADGTTIAGTSLAAQGARVFVWTAAAGTTEVPLTLDATSTPAVSALSADGSVLVGTIYSNATTSAVQRVFRWTRAGGTTYVTPADGYGTLGGVTADGSLTVGSIGQALFLSTAAGFVTLPFPPSVRNVVNLTLGRAGSLLLGSSGDLLFDGNELFAWTISPQGLAPLALPYDLSLTTWMPLGVSIDGKTFVATGDDMATVFTRP